MIYLTKDSLQELALYFLGDIPSSPFKYKSIKQIESFFNTHFDYNDKLDERAIKSPLRWKVVADHLNDLWLKNKFNLFINILLSDFSINTLTVKVNPIIAINNVQSYLKIWLSKYNLKLKRNCDGYTLVETFNFNIKEINSGGFAIIYYDSKNNIVYKRLRRELLGTETMTERFKREINILNELSNVDGVIKMYDYDLEELYYSMEKVDCTLNDYVLNNKLNDEEKEKLIYELLFIVRKIHNMNYIHRDLSPKNIFIKNKKVLLGDFGLSKNLMDKTDRQTLDTNNFGTYDYCDPEQLKKLSLAKKEFDVYSLGKVINFIMNENPSNFNHRYAWISEHAVSKSMRYKSASEMFYSFEEIINEKNCQINLITSSDDVIFNSLLYCKVEELNNILNNNELFEKYKKMLLILEDRSLKEQILYNIYNNIDMIHKDNYLSVIMLAEYILVNKFDGISKEIMVKIINKISSISIDVEIIHKIETLIGNENISKNLKKKFNILR